MAKLDVELELNVSRIEITAVISHIIRGDDDYGETKVCLGTLKLEELKEMIELYNEKQNEKT